MFTIHHVLYCDEPGCTSKVFGTEVNGRIDIDTKDKKRLLAEAVTEHYFAVGRQGRVFCPRHITGAPTALDGGDPDCEHRRTHPRIGGGTNCTDCTACTPYH